MDEPVLPGQGLTDYERYLRVPELLSLQKSADKMAHHDELLFQVQHQSAELWFKLILHEIDEAERRLKADRLHEAERSIARANEVWKVLTTQIMILTTMAPRDYHTIRLALGRGSGSESPGFRGVLKEARKVWPAFKRAVDARKVTLDDVYYEHASHYDLFRVAEAMTDFDNLFQEWRLTHVTLIKRIIGRDVRSLKGYSVHELEEDVKMQLYPELWAVRARLTERTGTSPPL